MALATICLFVFLCTGCSCSGENQDKVGDMAQAYSQRVSELVFACTHGKTEAVVEVSLRATDLSFSFSVPADEELGKTTERLKAMWTDGTKVRNARTDNQLISMQYRGCTIKWWDNGQMKTASDSNGDFHLDSDS